MNVKKLNMKWVEKEGIVKLELIGIKKMKVIKKEVKMVERKGIDIDI